MDYMDSSGEALELLVISIERGLEWIHRYKQLRRMTARHSYRAPT